MKDINEGFPVKNTRDRIGSKQVVKDFGSALSSGSTCGCCLMQHEEATD